MVPLVTRDFTFDELDAAEQSLEQSGLSYDVRGTRIFVRPADRHNVLRILHSADALPDGSLFDMAAAIADQNPFQSPEARAYADYRARAREARQRLFRKLKMDHMNVNTGVEAEQEKNPYLSALVDFFKARERRMRR